jgi:choline dehydrogenase-like flavoprotein
LILDIADLPDRQTLRTGVCIVGAGAAGIALALEFIGRDLDVLLLESGGLKPESGTQALYEGTVADAALHSPPDTYRQRRFGGSTTIWGGRCMPYDAIDFEPREYLPGSGWPLTLQDLTPWYPAANQLCEAGDFEYQAGNALRLPLRPMIKGFVSEDFSTDTLERFSRPTDFGRKFGQRLREARNIRVVLHANVTQVRLDAAGQRVQSLTVRSLAGRQITVQADQVVLATGGLEVPRLLLASRDVQPEGIGNSHDQVGRYYMCHLAGTIGRLQVNGPVANAYHGYDLSPDRIYCRRRIALVARAQREQRLANFVARLHHPRITDPTHENSVLSLLYLARPLIPYEYRKRLVDVATPAGAWRQHVANVVTGPAEAMGFAWHMLRDRKLARRKFPSVIIRSRANVFSLDFHAEQQPNAASRITLGRERDALGQPRLHVDWRYTPQDIDSVARSLALLREALHHSGAARFEFDAAGVETEVTRYGAYGGHHIGTARMGTDVRTSVVDADCRVHSVSNLYIAGSAVFPTSSQANPTLTIVAMALRLAHHLRGRRREV